MVEGTVSQLSPCKTVTSVEYVWLPFFGKNTERTDPFLFVSEEQGCCVCVCVCVALNMLPKSSVPQFLLPCQVYRAILRIKCMMLTTVPAHSRCSKGLATSTPTHPTNGISLRQVLLACLWL